MLGPRIDRVTPGSIAQKCFHSFIALYTGNSDYIPPNSYMTPTHTLTLTFTRVSMYCIYIYNIHNIYIYAYFFLHIDHHGSFSEGKNDHGFPLLVWQRVSRSSWVPSCCPTEELLSLPARGVAEHITGHCDCHIHTGRLDIACGGKRT